MVYKCFGKKSKGSGISASLANKSANELNYQLVNQLHKPIIRKFKKRKVYSSFRDDIWGVDLADMQSLSKYNKEIKYLLCAIDLFSKYAWVIPIKDKKGTCIVNAFKKIISTELHSKHKPNKIWVDQGSAFCNKSFEDFLKVNNIEMYSTYNEGKFVVAERFIRTLKNKIFKHVTAISKNVYFYVLDGIVNTITDHRTIKMKPIEVTNDCYAKYNGFELNGIAFNEDPSNKKNPKFEVVTMLKCLNIKNFLLKDILQIG